MKKVLSLVLVIAMVLSSFSFAFAAKFEDVEGDYEDAINALVALGVVRGYEDGTFRPENILTRAELAVLLVEALGYGELVAGSTSNFSDTQNHWSNGYVGIAAGTGLVLGYPDGTFKPDQPLTYDEAITMILRAIGYVDSALKGNWPTNFKVKAIDLKLLKDVNMATAAADRGGVAQILFNALELDMMELGEENVLVKAGRLFIDNIATPGTIDVTEDVIDPDHKDYAGDVVDLEPYMFENLDVYFNDDDVVVYVKDSNSTVYEGVVDDVLVRKGIVNVDVEEADESIEKVKFDDYDDEEDTIEVPIYENFVMRTDEYKQFIDLEDAETIKIVFNEDEDGDDVLTGIVVTQQTDAAQIENEYKEGRTKIDVFRLPVDDDDDVNLEKVVVKGAAESLEDIAEDDVVVEYAGYNDEDELVKTTLVVSRDTVEGKVTRAGSDYAYIGGTKYNLNEKSGYSANIGDKGIFYLDHNGEIVADKATKAEPTDYAIIINSATGTAIAGRFGGEYEVDEYPAIKLATQDNEVVVYDVFVEVKDNGDVDESATYINDDLNPKEFDLVVTGAAVLGDISLDFAEQATLDEGTLVKYILNDDGQIETIEYVKTTTLTAIDTTKATFKLAEGVIIFDARDDEDYAVVKESMLKDTIAGSFVYNDDGELEVIVTVDIKDDADDAVYAWIEGIELAYNADDEKVQVATVYMDGEEEDLYTDDDDVFEDAEDIGIYKLELDGNVITKATFIELPEQDTVEAVSTKNNMIKLEVAGWIVVAENATMHTLDVDDEFDEFVDIFDVAEGDTLKYVLNTDEDIAYFQLIIEK